MRLKIAHKDGSTTVTNADTGEVISGVVAVSFDRKSIDHDATVTLTLTDFKHGDIETDIEVHADSASHKAKAEFYEKTLQAGTLTRNDIVRLEGNV